MCIICVGKPTDVVSTRTIFLKPLENGQRHMKRTQLYFAAFCLLTICFVAPLFLPRTPTKHDNWIKCSNIQIPFVRDRINSLKDNYGNAAIDLQLFQKYNVTTSGKKNLLL